MESLKGQYIDTALSLNLSVDDLWESLDLCLSIRESAFCRLVAHGTAAEHGVVPDSMQIGGGSSRPIAATIGLCDGEKLALFVLGTDGIFIRSFGNGASLAKRLLRNIESWNESSRPRNSDLLVRAYPATGVTSLSWPAIRSASALPTTRCGPRRASHRARARAPRPSTGKLRPRPAAARSARFVARGRNDKNDCRTAGHLRAHGQISNRRNPRSGGRFEPRRIACAEVGLAVAYSGA